MEGGILEVLVVNAQGIKRRNFFGNPAYYVVVQCGTEVRRSKTTKGYHHEAFWNQKLEFEFPFSEWKSLTHLEISIMDDESCNDAGFVGRTMYVNHHKQPQAHLFNKILCFSSFPVTEFFLVGL